MTSVLLRAQAVTWLAEALKGLAIYCSRDGLSPRWAWAAPACYVLGGGPTLYTVVRDAVVSNGTDDDDR